MGMDTLFGYRLRLSGTVFLTETVRSTTLTREYGMVRGTWQIPFCHTLPLARATTQPPTRFGNDAHRGLKSVLVSTADVLRQASFRCELLDG